MTKIELKEKVEAALEEIRPYLVADGGNVSLVSIEDSVVTVQFEGACIGCKVNHMTLKNGVEATIKKHAPQITEVLEKNSI
ncbi:MAG: NifU family protein [Bacteroidota bacterium]